MNSKNTNGLKKFIIVAITGIFITLAIVFSEYFIYALSEIALYEAKTFLPDKGVTLPDFTSQSTTAEEVSEEITTKATTTTQATAEAKPVASVQKFTDTPEDIKTAIANRKKTASKDKKDGAIYEKQYKNEGVTNSFGAVKVKNVNKTSIDIEKILGEKIDLTVEKDKPSVLIFHTHTTETYQILDREFYEVGFMTRTKDSALNMVRVGKAICEEIEKAGYEVVHDTQIHDLSYNGAYEHSRKKVEE